MKGLRYGLAIGKGSNRITFSLQFDKQHRLMGLNARRALIYPAHKRRSWQLTWSEFQKYTAWVKTTFAREHELLEI